MEPKFQDPACIKFINGKFVLATNDPSNPVALVRQKTKGIETDVLVTLSNGETYEDTISSISHLVEVTSNKGWAVAIELSVCLVVYTDSHVGRAALISKTQKLLNTIHAYQHTPNSEYYLPVSRMIPQRIVPLSVSSDITFAQYDDRIRGSGKVAFEFAVISPAKHITELADELSTNLVNSFRGTTQFNTGGIEVCDRNVIGTNTEEYDLDRVLDMVLITDVDRTMYVTLDGRDCELTEDEVDQFVELLVGTSNEK